MQAAAIPQSIPGNGMFAARAPRMGVVLPGGALLRLSLGQKATEALILGDMLRRTDGRLAEITCLSRLAPEPENPPRLVHVCRDALAPGLPGHDILLPDQSLVSLPGEAAPLRAGDLPCAAPAAPDGTVCYLIGLAPPGAIPLAGLWLHPAPIGEEDEGLFGPLYRI